MENNYQQFLDRYTKSGKKVTDLSRAATLMNAVGNPQDSLRFVHIAGTNGKGSTAEMTAAALTAAGYRTGLFTSPFIVHYNDRIRIDGEEISDESLCRMFDIVKPKAEQLSDSGFSQFEITQAAAMLYFREQGCDVVVLEAGLGGKLDCTNVIAPPLVSVICSVALDHTAILGETVELIAEQKAGIIKKNSPCVLAPENPPEAVSVVKRHAEECMSQLVIPDVGQLEVNKCTAFGSEFIYKGNCFSVKMGGRHQIKNAITVIETLELLRNSGFDRIDKNAVDAGLSACVPARVQIICEKPLVILDGGHNPDGTKALAAALDTIDCPKHAVIGMLGDKDSAESAEYLAKAIDKFTCVDSFYPTAKKSAELAQLLRKYGAAAEASDLDCVSAVKAEFDRLSGNEALVICGSLYLAALFTGRENNIFEKGSV